MVLLGMLGDDTDAYDNGAYVVMSTPNFSTNLTYCLTFEYTIEVSEEYLPYHTTPGLQIYFRSEDYMLSGRKIWGATGLKEGTASVQIWNQPLRKVSQLDFVGLIGEIESSKIEVSNVFFTQGKCENMLEEECRENEFQCYDRRECITLDALCNGTAECSDWSDEMPPTCGEFTNSLVELYYIIISPVLGKSPFACRYIISLRRTVVQISEYFVELQKVTYSNQLQ